MKSMIQAAALSMAVAAGAVCDAAAQTAPAAAESVWRATTLNLSAYGEVHATPDMATISLGVLTDGHQHRLHVLGALGQRLDAGRDAGREHGARAAVGAQRVGECLQCGAHHAASSSLTGAGRTISGKARAGSVNS